MKRVLDVGNCGPDHAGIRAFVEANFDVGVDQADRLEDALQSLERTDYALILVNRELDCDGSDGTNVIRAIKQSRWSSVPIMLITNFADHQAASLVHGAVPGFGKKSLGSSATVDLLRPYLD